MFMALLAGFNVLLSRLSGQRDILIGTTTAGRNHLGLEELIGLFLNTLVLRVDLSEAVTFKELLQQVRRVSLEAYVHQDVSFEKVIEAMHLRRRLDHNLLFQVWFVLQNIPTESMHLSQVSLKPVAIDSTVAKFDLALSLAETQDGIVGSLEYSTDLFDAITVAGMLKSFAFLLRRFSEDPDANIFEAPLIEADDIAPVPVSGDLTNASDAGAKFTF